MGTPIKADRFIVANEKGMRALKTVLKKYSKTCNVYSGDGTSFALGYDSKPDSDWGRYEGAQLRVIVANKTFRARVEDTIRKALGFPKDGALFPLTEAHDE